MLHVDCKRRKENEWRQRREGLNLWYKAKARPMPRWQARKEVEESEREKMRREHLLLNLISCMYRH